MNELNSIHQLITTSTPQMLVLIILLFIVVILFKLTQFLLSKFGLIKFRSTTFTNQQTDIQPTNAGCSQQKELTSILGKIADAIDRQDKTISQQSIMIDKLEKAQARHNQNAELNQEYIRQYWEMKDKITKDYQDKSIQLILELTTAQQKFTSFVDKLYTDEAWKKWVTEQFKSGRAF